MTTRPFLVLAASIVAFLAAGCSSKPSVPQLQFPTHLEAFCGDKEPRATAMMSILTSTDDRPMPESRGENAIRSLVRSGGGAIAFWNDQAVLLPRTAALVGEKDSFVHVTELVVPIVPEGVPKRRIFIRVNEHGAQRWIALDAFDVQNPCIAGHRAM